MRERPDDEVLNRQLVRYRRERQWTLLVVGLSLIVVIALFGIVALLRVWKG